jgi:hypothetical protein
VHIENLVIETLKIKDHRASATHAPWVSIATCPPFSSIASEQIPGTRSILLQRLYVHNFRCLENFALVAGDATSLLSLGETAWENPPYTMF